MEKFSITPTLQTYALRLPLCERQGVKFDSLLREMKENGIVPDALVLAQMFLGSIEGGQATWAKSTAHLELPQSPC